MENNKNKNGETGLEAQNLSSFKSPPKDSIPEEVNIGDDTPADTTQGYAEKNSKPNPADAVPAKGEERS